MKYGINHAHASVHTAIANAMAERPAKEKFSHAQVAYEHPAKGEDHCGECMHYIKETPMRCEIVRNPIRAEDWCRKFKEKLGESAAYERKEHEEYAKEHS